MNIKSILITGATGFIGSKTLKALQDLGFKTKVFIGDVRQVGDWVNNLEDGQIILHLASIRTETSADYEVNVKGTENLFEASSLSHKNPSKIILISSQAVYLGNNSPFKEDLGQKPTTIYGKSKLEEENKALTICRELSIPLVILRYSTVLGYGIRKKSNMSGPLFIWTDKALRGEPLEVLQNGEQTRDYVHVDDVVGANILAINTLKQGIYNVGGGKSIKLIDLANWVKDASGANSGIIIRNTKSTPSDPKELFSDISKLESYGWKPQKSAKEAVFEFVKTFKS